MPACEYADRNGPCGPEGSPDRLLQPGRPVGPARYSSSAARPTARSAADTHWPASLCGEGVEVGGQAVGAGGQGGEVGVVEAVGGGDVGEQLDVVGGQLPVARERGRRPDPGVEVDDLLGDVHGGGGEDAAA